MMKSMILVLTLVVLAAGAFASGGAYLDDLRIANNGLAVFSDNFDDGKLDGWMRINDTTVTCNTPGKPPCGMFVNAQKYRATAYHSLTLRNAGLIEVSAKVYLTAPEEQYEWQIRKQAAFLGIHLYSGSSTAIMQLDIQLDPGQQQAKLCVARKDKAQCQPSNPLAKYRWANITLRMDPKTKTASALLEGQPQVSLPYEPEEWRSIREVGINSSYGDGSQHTD